MKNLRGRRRVNGAAEYTTPAPSRGGQFAARRLRVGVDIVGPNVDNVTPTFNAAFSLSGSVVPEPSTWALLLLGFAGLGFAGHRHARRVGAASA